MKLSIGLFAAASAVGTDDPAFETPSPLCDAYVAKSENYVNCWSPSGHFGTENGTVGFVQQNEGGECGFQYIDTEYSIVNKTCSFTPAFDENYTVGNGVFVAKGATYDNQIVGLDMTGDFNYVQKWDVYFDWTQDFNEKLDAYVAAVNEANEQNTTQPEPFTYERVYDCQPETAAFVAPSDDPADPNKNCEDLGAPYADYAIMFTNQHAEDKNNNYAIANYQGGIGEGNAFTISINQPCTKYGFTAHDNNQVDFEIKSSSPSCDILVTVKNPAAQLFYFQGSIDEGVIDFFNDVTIA